MDVKIKDEVVAKLQKRVDSTDEFNSIEEYVNNILEQVVQKLEEDNNPSNDASFSGEDEEKVKERLRSLGYLE